jgi:hypothetical protein
MRWEVGIELLKKELDNFKDIHVAITKPELDTLWMDTFEKYYTE